MLESLGAKLNADQVDPIRLVICGATAMALAGVASRPTRDVDVIAMAEDSPDGIRFREAILPESVRKHVASVAADYGLRRSSAWLNTGPKALLAQGLPQGAERRVRFKDFGPRLRVYWLARLDLIHLKLLAATDDRGPRHTQHEADLRAMQPSHEELDQAVEWLKGRSDYHNHQIPLHRLLNDMGHEDLAYYT